jgi:hypothetical protein
MAPRFGGAPRHAQGGGEVVSLAAHGGSWQRKTELDCGAYRSRQEDCGVDKKQGRGWPFTLELAEGKMGQLGHAVAHVGSAWCA